MYCQKCGSEIDNNAVVCDHCGAATGVKAVKKKKPFYKRWWFWVIVLVLVMSSCSSGEAESEDMPTEPTVIENNENEATEEATDETEPEITEPAVPTYSESMYKVGSDIDAGEYFIYSASSVGTYMEVSEDSSGDSIIHNENFDTFIFVTVEDGQYFTVKRGEFVNASDAVVPGADANGVYSEGMYRVGTDIPAGEYKVTSTSDFGGYLEVNADSSGDSIIHNDNFDTSVYVTVEEGQYFMVSRAEFTPA